MKNIRVMKSLRTTVAVAILGLLSILAVTEKKPSYLVIEAVDGDTVKAYRLKPKAQSWFTGQKKNKLITIRYLGIDSPEMGKEEECFAQEAKKINEELVSGKKVKLEYDKDKLDQFGRTLAYVWVGKTLVNEELLQKGAGRFYADEVNKKYQERLIKAANAGHEQKQGLWGKCDPLGLGCVIKGNLDRLDKRWYHLPTFRHYKQVVVNLANQDRWFCTEEEALKAGFERARE